MRTSLLFAGLTSLLLSTNASAGFVPPTIPLSGTLTDANGMPLEGSHEISIVWFDRDGNEVAVEDVTINGSSLHHMSTTPAIAEAAGAGSLYEVELSVDGEVMAPRISLGSVPYALRAGQAALADSASSAVHADSATSCMMLGDKSPDYFLPAHQMTWARLPDKPLFDTTSPVHLYQRSGTNTWVFGLDTCPDEQGLVSSGSQWSCQPYASATSLSTGSTTLYASTLNTLEVGPGAITDAHISASGLAPEAIRGGAIVSTSLTSQTVQNTIFYADGNVGIGQSLAAGISSPYAGAQIHVEGLVALDALTYTQPQLRQQIIAPEDFRLVGSSYDKKIELVDNGSLIMSEGFDHVIIRAPLTMPEDAILTGVVCDIELAAGNLAASKLRLVEITSYNMLDRNVLAELDMGFLSPSNALQSWSAGLALDLTRGPAMHAITRFVLEIQWSPDQPGDHAKLAGCRLSYTTKSL